MRPDASVVGSVFTLLPFFLLGVALGVLFDGFRLLRLWRHGGKNRIGGKFTSSLLRRTMRRVILKGEPAALKNLLRACDNGLIVAEDVLFCLAASVLYLLLQYDINSGIFRWYLLLLCVAGFSLYLVTLGKVTMRFALFLTALFRCLALLLYNHTVYYCVLGLCYAFRAITGAVRNAARGAYDCARKKRGARLEKDALNKAEALAARGFLYDGCRRRKRWESLRYVRKAKAGKNAKDDSYAAKKSRTVAAR